MFDAKLYIFTLKEIRCIDVKVKAINTSHAIEKFKDNSVNIFKEMNDQRTVHSRSVILSAVREKELTLS